MKELKEMSWKELSLLEQSIVEEKVRRKAELRKEALDEFKEFIRKWNNAGVQFRCKDELIRIHDICVE